MFAEAFAKRSLPFDAGCAAGYAEVVTERRRAGTPISQFDAQIAAIALSHRLSLATHNLADFEGCGLVLAHPWNAG